MHWPFRKRSRPRLPLASVVVPATLVFFVGFPSAAVAGNFWATGHDQDFHCAGGDLNECAYYKITTDFVRAASTLPVLILDRDNSTPTAPGSTGHASQPYEAVAALNLADSNGASSMPTASSPPYVVEDPQGLQTTIINGTPPPGITTASTWATTPLVDGSGRALWSAIIIASDTNCGGCDLNNTDGTHLDSDAINARTTDITNYFNAGGGLLYLAGASNAFNADATMGKDVYYASVPVPVGGQPVSAPFTVTPDGVGLGITDAMVNCCATHNSFSLPPAGGVLKVAETDSSGLAESVFVASGAVCTTGFCSSDPTITAAGSSGFTATEGASTTGTVATFTDQDTAATAAEYSATIDWGDGTTTSAGTVTGSGGSFTVSGTHTYSSRGSFTITTTIADTDNSNNAATATATALVSGPPTIVALGTPVVHSSTGADLSSTVNPDGLPTSAFFQYGLDARYRGKGATGIVYDQSTSVQAVGSDFSAHAVSASVSGLVPNALYHVRLVTSNGAGKVFGADQTFMTAQDPAPPGPVLGKEVNVRPVSGLVFIRPPAGKSLAHVSGAVARAALAKGQGFVPLTEARQIPTGSQIDARQGSLQVTTASVLRRGKPQIGTFGSGVFKITQARSRVSKGLSTLTLLEGLFRGAPSYTSCRATAHGASLFPSAQAARLSRAVLQTLRANVHGHFRVRGRYSAGVSRGTNWGTRDQCNGTLTVVRRGTVAVRDFALRKTILVHAGQRYLAKP